MTHPPPRADWIAARVSADTVQVWAMQGARALASATGATDGTVGDSLLRLAEPWLPASGAIRALLCGAPEAGLVTIPCKPLDLRALPSALADPRLTLFQVPGLHQPNPPAMLRGAEMQIAGYLSLNPGWDGVICLPGARSSWAHVSAGEIVSFQSFLTGALVAQLGTPAPLPDVAAKSDWNDDAFARALDETMSRPERLAAQLAVIEAEQALSGLSSGQVRLRLWGALIGAELAASRPYWLGQQITIIGSAQDCAPYAAALARQGVPAGIADGTHALLAGLAHIHRAQTADGQADRPGLR